LLITGASGVETTTLGRALADRWCVPHADVDDYFWLPTSPPYTRKRPEKERLRLMSQVFVPRSSWVLSGSVMGWGDSLLAMCDAIVFLTLDADLRMSRLRERELARYGDVDDVAHEAFFEWAQSYDDPTFSGRSRVRHERWLATTSRPVLRLDGALPVQDLVEAVDRWLD
jgi:adenylate kinase family enzyme